ncbi:hypothetical protein WMY93_019574 [Mugilogobius chulae]|uniref:Uncharacterized protein n=1 Tax=Mugilogobius chulae TaxID=88201 RepID=A0AAW0NRJ4_9GOBI
MRQNSDCPGGNREHGSLTEDISTHTHTSSTKDCLKDTFSQRTFSQTQFSRGHSQGQSLTKDIPQETVHQKHSHERLSIDSIHRDRGQSPEEVRGQSTDSTRDSPTEDSLTGTVPHGQSHGGQSHRGQSHRGQSHRGQSSPMEDSLTEHSLTEDSLTEDSLTEDRDSPTEDSLTEDSLTEDSPTEDSPTENSLTEDSPTEDSLTEDSLTEDSLTEDSFTEDSLTDSQFRTGQRQSAAVIFSHVHARRARAGLRGLRLFTGDSIGDSTGDSTGDNTVDSACSRERPGAEPVRLLLLLRSVIICASRCLPSLPPLRADADALLSVRTGARGPSRPGLFPGPCACVPAHDCDVR